jgi:FKBP-type peptidyl-prolyl cis-trans isomerase
VVERFLSPLLRLTHAGAGEPVKFPSNQVIKGWQEGLALMSAGSKATMVIPSDLAYGDTGAQSFREHLV